MWCGALIGLLALSAQVRADDYQWWQTATFYQIYPYSFRDSDGDGWGDLKGITNSTQYLKDIGVDAVWMSPIFESPNVDFGYDISNFKKIQPVFGTMSDFDDLVAAFHDKDIKVLLDFVPNHSSDQHEWFQASRNGTEEYKDFYVWRDPSSISADGTPNPPNNWINVNSDGSSWKYDKTRKQFYLHQFAAAQPDLNYRNDKVKDAMKDVLKFWLDKGIDGFRMDAVPFIVEDEKLRDETPISKECEGSMTYSCYYHNMTMDQEGTYDTLAEFYEVVTKYSNSTNTKVMVLEAYTSIPNTMRYYSNNNKTVSTFPFNFFLLNRVNKSSDANDLNTAIHDWMDAMPKDRWPNWVTGNHDNFRTATRNGRELADAFNMLVALLPGTAFFYYGEELAMTNTFVRWNETMDPRGLTKGQDGYLDPNLGSRDPERTPMQWDNTPYAGFSLKPDKMNRTWLPVNPNYYQVNVKNETDDDKSSLNVFKKIVKLRKDITSAQNLSTAVLSKYVFGFARLDGSDVKTVVLINLSNKPEHVNMTAWKNIDLPDTLEVYVGSPSSQMLAGDTFNSKDSITLPPKAAVVFSFGLRLAVSWTLLLLSFIWIRAV